MVAAAGCAAGPEAVAPKLTLDGVGEVEHQPSQGYVLVDVKKCQGCLTCMLACSLAHEGRESLSLSRIQVMQNPFAKFPDDLTIEACRQCVEPECVRECPSGALSVDVDNGNVRSIDEELCEGCGGCVYTCPHAPSRAIWKHEEELASKCDLCAGAEHFSEDGGVGGRQACIEVCPVNAIKFQSAIPVQEGDAGNKVDLRGKSWGMMGYVED